MGIQDFINQNKIKSAAGALTAFLSLVAAMWAFDSHYAKAADLDVAVQTLSTGQKTNAIEMQILLNKQSARELKSKINDIEDKQAATRKVDPYEMNRKKRLEGDLEDIKKETGRLERQKFELEKQLLKK